MGRLLAFDVVSRKQALRCAYVSAPTNRCFVVHNFGQCERQLPFLLSVDLFLHIGRISRISHHLSSLGLSRRMIAIGVRFIVGYIPLGEITFSVSTLMYALPLS